MNKNMTTREAVELAISNSEKKFGVEDSFGSLRAAALNISDSLTELIEMRDGGTLPKVSTEEKATIEQAIRVFDVLVKKITDYPGRDPGKKDDITNNVLKLEHTVIPLCRTIFSSPETKNSILRTGKDIELIKDKLEKELVPQIVELKEMTSGLKSKLFESASNILGESFHKIADRSGKLKWLWFVVIVLGVLFFNSEARELAGTINLFIEQGRTSYEIILMLVLERAALILLPIMCIYFGMKQFNILSHIQAQNNHKGNIGDVFAKIYKANQGDSKLKEKTADLLVKLAEEYTDGYIDGGGMKIKKITTPIGEINS